MPCTLCSTTFNIMPCKFYEQDLVDRLFFPLVKPNIFNQRTFDIRWDLMKNRCPCIECLVKGICLELCRDYVDSIILLADKMERKNDLTKTS